MHPHHSAADWIWTAVAGPRLVSRIWPSYPWTMSTTPSEKVRVLYTAEATATGGRKGHGRSSDGRVDVGFSSPTEMGGDGGPGTHAEQPSATGFAAAFQHA